TRYGHRSFRGGVSLQFRVAFFYFDGSIDEVGFDAVDVLESRCTLGAAEEALDVGVLDVGVGLVVQIREQQNVAQGQRCHCSEQRSDWISRESRGGRLRVVALL